MPFRHRANHHLKWWFVIGNKGKNKFHKNIIKKFKKNKKILLTKSRNNVNIIDVNVTRTLATE